jgi:hypothetical protein
MGPGATGYENGVIVALSLAPSVGEPNC